MSGFGTHWGFGWGGYGPGDPFAINGARASAPNAVRVYFNKAPALVSPLRAWDASRLSNWTLTRTDASQTLSILAASAVTGYPNVVELTIVQRWASPAAEYTITASAGMRAADTVEVIGTRTADFLGMVLPTPNTERDQGPVDLFSPQTSETYVTGGLVVATDGDYQVEGGITYLKKLIIRDVVYLAGEFAHATDFGAGQAVKGIVRGGDLVTRRRVLEQRIGGYPEVESVTVSIDQFKDGRQVVRIKARTSLGVVDESVQIGGTRG